MGEKSTAHRSEPVWPTRRHVGTLFFPGITIDISMEVQFLCIFSHYNLTTFFFLTEKTYFNHFFLQRSEVILIHKHYCLLNRNIVKHRDDDRGG